MRGNVISYIEMCQKEGTSLQRGMNFRLKGHHSVILMSVRPNSPYRDEVQEDGAVLIYEGHDEPKRNETPNPKSLDQPERRLNGKLTENGKFHQAAQQFKSSQKAPDIVQVYEGLAKLNKPSGIYGANGLKKKKNLLISDKVGSSKTQKSSKNEQVTRDFITSMVEHSKFIISLAGGRVGSTDGEATGISHDTGIGAH